MPRQEGQTGPLSPLPTGRTLQPSPLVPAVGIKLNTQNLGIVFIWLFTHLENHNPSFMVPLYFEGRFCLCFSW